MQIARYLKLIYGPSCPTRSVNLWIGLSEESYLPLPDSFPFQIGKYRISDLARTRQFGLAKPDLDVAEMKKWDFFFRVSSGREKFHEYSWSKPVWICFLAENVLIFPPTSVTVSSRGLWWWKEQLHWFWGLSLLWTSQPALHAVWKEWHEEIGS